jgi:hypothetical protein
VLKNVLVVCEKSGVVRDAFLKFGIKAISCDLEETQSPGPHLIADYHSLDYSGFDLLIAHPPCRFLSRAGAGVFWDTHREEQQAAVNDVLWLYSRPVPHICIENPAGFLTKAWRHPDQYIDPWWFGHKEKKHTGLWLKALPPLMSTLVYPDPVDFVRQVPHTARRSEIRSRTFTGIAAAMASQWGLGF